MGKIAVNFTVNLNTYSDTEFLQNLQSLKLLLDEELTGFYFGITSTPDRRAEDHEDKLTSDGQTLPKSMEVFYEGDSEADVKALERNMIKEHKNDPRLKNEVAGGGGDLRGPSYYVYVLIWR